MQFDYSKLLGRIKEFGYTQGSLAAAIGITPSTMSQKLNNKAHFDHEEMYKICELLNVADAEIVPIFFTRKVEKNSTIM